jgi:hypothetical protein
VTADQLRAVINRLITAGHWQPGDSDIVIVADAGYDITRLAHVLADMPVELVGRLRSDRVLRLPTPARAPGTTGRPRPRDRPEQARDLAAAAAHHEHRDSPLRHRGGHQLGPGPPAADPPRLPDRPRGRAAGRREGDRNPKPVWLWTSTTGATAADVDRWWQALLRRFDLEHTFRLFKHPWLDHTEDPHPRCCRPLDLAGHRRPHPTPPARPLVVDLRRPWERPAHPDRLTPTRVRRGFRNIRPATLLPARAPKPGRPGPGRPSGSRNRYPATSYDVGKTVKRDRTITARRQRTG